MTGPAGDPHPVGADEMNSALLRIAFPDFWFGQLTHRRRPPRWVAVCKDDTGPGLHTVAAADVDALTAALLLDRAWRAGYAAPGARP